MIGTDAIEPEALRARLVHALRLDVGDAGSLLLHALGACYLAVPSGPVFVDPELEGIDREKQLELAFYAQAEAEEVDGDEVLTAIAMVDGTGSSDGGAS